MCIRDRFTAHVLQQRADMILNWLKERLQPKGIQVRVDMRCLLYTSDAADDLLCVDLGGRRIIKKKNINEAKIKDVHTHTPHIYTKVSSTAD